MDHRSDLLRRLLEYARRVPTDQHTVREFEVLLALPGDPFSRVRYQPGHVTASGVVLSPDGGSVLMILHAKLGRWLQPGGHVESTDVSLRAAAAREVLEETGIEVEEDDEPLVDLDIHDIPGRPEAPAHEHFDVRFGFRAREGQALRVAEVLAARWIPTGEVQQMQTDSSVLRAVSRFVERHRQRSIGATPGVVSGV
jgi:8-oxo-dGTP pyrophosphatase MutT (NUDIX family)